MPLLYNAVFITGRTAAERVLDSLEEGPQPLDIYTYREQQAIGRLEKDGQVKVYDDRIDIIDQWLVTRITKSPKQLMVEENWELLLYDVSH